MGEKGGVPATKAIFIFYSLEFVWVMEKEGRQFPFLRNFYTSIKVNEEGGEE